MSYSLEFRSKVLLLKEQCGLSYRATASRFGISVNTVVNWSKHLEPRPHRKPHYKIDLLALKKDVQDFPYAYQYERAARLNVSQNTICLSLRKLKITHKKNSQSPQKI